ncbi:hypothetical protein SAMN05920897_10550 [Alkalispirochaeta americana]|uniref:DUF624 domain-containing protein n=1 Tax=Alkalispirochaeta americana TaxID=159291 RepID=A0A1N6QU49_9SPIO|nr:hypothetical protein [Alkalispirochaeta americana]SIQ20131.1 hypothetical protein SAMN05920897_10550 [Alkalispirochaeta americana]
MFGFLIKKAFFDLWDNFLPVMLLNLGFIAVIALPILLPAAVAPFGPVAGITALIIGVLVVFCYIGGLAGVARTIVDYESLEWNSFFSPLRQFLPVTLSLGAAVLLHCALLLVAIPVYTALGNLFSIFALAILFWMSLIWWLAIQYVLPVRARLSRQPLAVLKKSFILTLDNTFFTIAIALGAVVIAVLSTFTAFLLPGAAGIAIWYQAALKLRLYKYDHLEETVDKKASIPWDALLYKDRERVGKRTLRGMIFPWKE